MCNLLKTWNKNPSSLQQLLQEKNRKIFAEATCAPVLSSVKSKVYPTEPQYLYSFKCILYTK